MSLDIESPSIHSHLNMLQGVINRMAGNSAMCKTLCTTLVSTVGAISYAGNSPNGMLVAVLPILLFFYLDAMYLSLEKGFIKSYNAIVDDIHTGQVDKDILFKIIPPKDYKTFKQWWDAAYSWATLPTYVLLSVLTFVIMQVVTCTPQN